MQTVSVENLMTRDPITTSPDVPITVALEAMRANAVRRLPVVSKTGSVAGILTMYDAMLALRKGQDWFSAGLEEVPNVKEIMTANVITVAPDESVARAARLMLSHKIGALPVVENLKLVGIITESDLFRYMVDLLEGDKV